MLDGPFKKARINSEAGRRLRGGDDDVLISLGRAGVWHGLLVGRGLHCLQASSATPRIHYFLMAMVVPVTMSASAALGVMVAVPERVRL